MKSFTNNEPLTYGQLFKIENDIYNEEIIRENIEKKEFLIEEILERKTEIFEDRTFNLPQNIFLLKYYNGCIVVGRKIRSILSLQNKINALHCSMLTASMILGILKNNKQKGKAISIEYFPLTKEEKKCIFEKIKTDRMIDIYYPYKYLDFKTEEEEHSPKEGWSLNPEKVIYLGYGEEHIRDYTVRYLSENGFIKENMVIYDPACSTGQFLNTIKKAFPSCKTIGQDLSKEMVDYASEYVDEVYCGDAINSPLEDESIDIMFLRFLNSEVVTTEYAHKLFDTLVKKVKKNGLIIAFGHTPLLLKEEYFVETGLNIEQKNAYSEKYDCIFQYYVLRR